MTEGPRNVALAHDYLLVMRGAERTFAAISDCWPTAPIATAIYSESGTGGRFANRSVTTSFLQRQPLRQRGFRALLPLYPRAIEGVDLEGHDLVVASSSAFAHGVSVDDSSVLMCYCHTPFRYAWHERDRALAAAAPVARPLLRMTLDRIKAWDVAAAGRVDHYIANSELTRERIRLSYGREATVIHPPVEVDRFSPGQPQDYFLVVTELVPHKRIDVALAAARKAGATVKVVGTGPDRARLEGTFSDVATFVGRVPDAELATLYAEARALLVTAVEEFGIAAVESQAAGRPVLGVGKGGLRETVVDGVSGILVPQGTSDEFAEAMREVDFNRFDANELVRQASRFSADRFRSELTAEVARSWESRAR